MLTFVRELVFVGVIVHLSLVLIESSYFGDVFAFLGHTGLMFVHITVLLFVAAAALISARRQHLGKTWLTLAGIWVLYAAWAVFCTLPSVHTVDRMCELILSPLTVGALFLCVPTMLERRHYRAIFLLFSALFALHTLCVAWIMCKNDPTFFGRQVIGTDGRPKIFGPIHLPQTDGIFRSPNGIGSFLALFPAYLLSEFLTTRGWFRAPLTVAGILIGVGLLLSFCRAAEAAALIGFLLPIIVFMKKMPVKRALACAAILLMTVFVSLPDHHQSAYMKSTMGAHTSGPGAARHVVAFVAHTTTTRRTEIWLAYLRDWQARPLTGYGLLGADYQGLSPHNFLLANLVYYGIPGLLLLVALLALATRQVIRRMRDYPELVIPIAGGLASLIFVHGSVEYSITYPLYFTNSAFWLFLGYVCFTHLGKKTVAPDLRRQHEQPELVVNAC